MIGVPGPATVPRHIRVACAIIERDGLVLAAQRSASMSLPLKWEFPGGKIDGEETPEECLHRELREELGVRVEIRGGIPPTTHRYAAFSVTLHPFVCALGAGTPSAHEHAALVWLEPGQLPSLDWAEADLPVIAAYLASREGGR